MTNGIDLRCYTSGKDCVGGAVETHWRISRRSSDDYAYTPVESWPVCTAHIKLSRDLDAEPMIARQCVCLYLPIVQPVMGSEQALAMEAALFAVGRLLLLCKRHDGTQAERDEAEQTLELLREAQAEAWLRRVHKETA